MTVSRTLTDQAPAPDIAAGDEPHYRMFVRDLVLASSIGAHAHERGASQRVRINVDLRIRESPAPIALLVKFSERYEVPPENPGNLALCRP